METIVLEAKVRDKSQKLNHLRKADRLPVTYYGNGVKNLDFDLDYQDFRRAFKAGGQNTVMDLTVDGKPLKVLVHDMQFDPVSDRFIHVDFISVDMNKEVSTSIPLVFVGTSPAVREMGGTLMDSLSEVNVKCLARDLIHEIEVDLSLLVDFHSVVHVSDLKVPSTVEITDDPELAIATVTAPKSEDELAAEDAEDAAAAAAAMEAVKDDGKEEGGSVKDNKDPNREEKKEKQTEEG
ncbi:MAG: 50S ribosomal protein L25 [Candidatus Peregrinibacteria bacterium]|nr:50S ribosomal protein L25 [Candidatus Peregrinibacteria bacterium]MDZ4245048.1 50S ribosomal protein L25 [Candidatus Gracilibacteria bacterium]